MNNTNEKNTDWEAVANNLLFNCPHTPMTNEAARVFVNVAANIFKTLGIEKGKAVKIEDIRKECATIRAFVIYFCNEHNIPWNKILVNNIPDGIIDGHKETYEEMYEDDQKDGPKQEELPSPPAPEPAPAPEPKEEPKQEEKEEPKPEPEPAPEPKPEAPKRKAKPKPKAPTIKDLTLDKLVAMVKAGLRNIWMHGPAGCGKTTLAAALADTLGVECYVLSCSKDTDPSQIQGRRYPNPEESKLTEYYEKPSVLVLDEFTSVEADTAMLLNSALANGYYETSAKRLAKRHPDCVIVATSNTLGLGGDATYCGNSRLDASTRDRFACGFVSVDYSAEYEKQFDKEVVSYANKLREVIKRNDLQQIVSTRTIIHANMLKRAGLEWMEAMTSTWSKEEKLRIPFYH